MLIEIVAITRHDFLYSTLLDFMSSQEHKQMLEVPNYAYKVITIV